LLRAHIRYSNVDRDLRVVMVISAAPGDGKSTVARNLAFAASSAGDRVLFVEADLRRPTAANDFGVHHSPGIAEVLIEGVPLEEAVQHTETASGSSAHVGVDVLVAGGVLPPNPTQVIESQAMDSLLNHARNIYDFVVIDTPPLALLSDAFSLLRDVDGVLIVSRLGQNRRDVASRLKSTLDAANAPIIGVVANGYKERGSTPYGYGYGYAYGYGSYMNERGQQAGVINVSTNGHSPGAVTNGGSGAAGAAEREPAAVPAEQATAPPSASLGAEDATTQRAAGEAEPKRPAAKRRGARQWPGSGGLFGGG
jgi:capsular exopolysaccharide synthesis family protein